MRLGFIGTGGISTAIVTGLCTGSSPVEAIRVSPRSEENAGQLSREYETVDVGSSNQDVIDHSDMVFIAVLPDQKQAVLGPLKFREDQIIVTLLAGIPISDIRSLVKPANQVIRAVPLPCTALRTGPVVICPDHDTVSAVFDRVGDVISLDDESHLETLSIITALMAPFYAMAAEVAAWGENQGLDRKKAAAYTGSMFKALSLIAETAPGGDIQALVKECMTPGGFNELAMKIIDENGGFKHIPMALEAVQHKDS